MKKSRFSEEQILGIRRERTHRFIPISLANARCAHQFGCLATFGSGSPGRLQLPGSLGMDGVVVGFQAVLGRHIAQSAVQAHGVVVADKLATTRLASSMVSGVLGRMACSLRVRWKRSSFPLLCG